MSKKKFPKVVTSECTAAYAYVNKPDENGKFADGKYKVTGVFDADTDMSKIEAAAQASAGSGRSA